ncbi:MAG: response regulator [Campylobacterales bacterium]|nr:response regulator [Campylobacterales bacterium]
MSKGLFNEGVLEFLRTLTILCVEDEEDIRIIYKSIFSSLAKNVIFASDGVEGLQKYKKNHIDIIVTDHQMPHLTGLDMVSEIRKVDENIPIILITAFGDSTLLTKALNLNINSFVQKPIPQNEILFSIEKVTKILIANKYLQDKDEYQSYQENLGFAKELNILRNDFYYQMIDSDGISLLDFLYNPIDIMSGDAYSARRIDEHRTLYLVVDGMGKGVSASLTTMIITSFINHLVDKMTSSDNFDMYALINESIEFIKPILLEEEALALDFVVINNETNQLYYSKFAMPVLLMQDINNNIIRIKSNNPPLSKYMFNFRIDTCNIDNITKFLIYSDGIVENETKYDERPYGEFIEDDFLNSFTREELKDRFFEKIDAQEDDITLIFIKKIHETKIDIDKRVFDTRLSVVEEEASEWYAAIWDEIGCDMKTSYQASLVFTELLMNAYEHGNLGIDKREKHKLLDDNLYLETLLEKEQECDKEIYVTVSKIIYKGTIYIITLIEDEGMGFDTQILSEIFRNSHRFNGRGVFVSRKNSLGIYYNAKGNAVLYLNKL